MTYQIGTFLWYTRVHPEKCCNAVWCCAKPIFSDEPDVFSKENTRLQAQPNMFCFMVMGQQQTQFQVSKLVQHVIVSYQNYFELLPENVLYGPCVLLRLCLYEVNIV